MRVFLYVLPLVLALGQASADPKYCLNEMVKSDERIRSHGYPAETHEVVTEDGYVLTLFRIPYSHKLNNQHLDRPPVLLQHGLFSNSDCWLCSGPDDSLAYLLADAGYDVWLGNARGNIYSRSNTEMSVNNPKFWHFDWHEIGTIDIAAMIDYILDETQHSQLHYAGHSQGTTVYLVLMSERPEYNEKIKSGHLLAPCAFFEHGASPIFTLLSPLVGTPGGIWNQVFVDSELIPHNNLINRIGDTACGHGSPFDSICKNGFLMFANGGYENINLTSMQTLIETHPGGSSGNQGIHYIQLSVSNKFRQYDWGTKKNLALYGQELPPDYDLSKITAKTHSYSSHNDALCGPEDVDTMVSKFTHLTEDHRVPLQSFNHLDFIVANNMKELVNDLIVERINTYESR
ncbi:lipase 3 [Drosophila grimshawi]|uniref:Lipase n=1 Tax=Drosophila grimshawi TaxID=7222 RepID=B4IYZ5_DROGR|nr:lipase 3 [Drosophila grimshawi]EDV97703.1 GH14550 [Drosophila grimshawi]